MVGDDDLYRFITLFEGYNDSYSSVSEFKEHLAAEYLSSEKCTYGWIFWTPDRYGWVFWTPDRDDEGCELRNITDNVYGRSIPEKIICVLTRLMSSWLHIDMAQFWASKEVGGRSILTISDQPFAVTDRLRKGISWYRKKCMEHHYIVDDGAEKEQLGPPGRVFRNGRPESSPDLRLYSVKEFSLRDHAASCGEISYLALPVFDLHHNQCVGVLEFVSCIDGAHILLHGSDICHELKAVEMRTSHLNDCREQLIDRPWETKKYPINYGRLEYRYQQPNEITEMLELASKAIPQLHLAQVMVPCEQCGNSSKSFHCMKLVASIIKNGLDDPLLYDFFLASKFHNVQNGQGIGGFALSSANKSCFCQNVSDFSIIDYPVAHYAQVARLSFGFAICLRNMNHRSDLYVFEFFLQPQSRDPTNIWFVLRLLLKIMEDTLRGFKLATGQKLAEKLIADEIRRKYMSTSPRLGQNNIFPFGFEVIPYGLEILHQHVIRFSVPMEGCDENYSIFELREYLQKPNLHCFRESENGFICYRRENDELLESGGSHNPTLEFLATTENIRTENIRILMRKFISGQAVCNYLIQIWEPKIINNRLYLSTSDQPFALGYLGRGLCWYRKQCMEHLYYVGDGVKEEELGPPGRVFLTGHLESSPDLRLYSAREFPLLVHVVHCCAREYLALPLFYLQRKYCLGILECIGLPYDLENVLNKLKEVNLRSTHVNYDLSSTNIVDGRKQAVAEIQEMFNLLENSPKMLAVAWKSCSQCANMNIETFCLEQICDTYLFPNCKFQKVNIGKGVAGRVLESENKMCYFENLGDFSKLDYPWAHYAQENRFGSCFVICLRSSQMESYLYVLEFFMSPGCNRDGYPRSYLSFLLSIMKKNLKSFKVASGQQLGEHLLSQAIGYGEKDQFLFKTVRYGHEIDQMKNFEREQNIIGTSSNEGNKRDESKTSFHISYKDLEPHFGKRLEDAANDLGVSRSTLKRVRKECGITRWPSNVKNKKNPSLFQTKTSNKKHVQNLGQQISKASSSNLPISDFPTESNVPQTCIATTREVDKTCQENNVVTIKAKFNEDIIKFDLCLSSGLEKLVDGVAKRLHLLPGNFKLKYKDDEDDLIWLTCDEDWHNHVKSMRSLGKTTVHVLVHLVSN